MLNRLGYEAKDVSLHLVEISATMQTVQANSLCISHREVDPNLPHNHEVNVNLSMKNLIQHFVVWK